MLAALMTLVVVGAALPLAADARAAEGTDIAGGPSTAEAAAIEPGRYLDSIEPGAERWYEIELAAGEALAVGGALYPPASLEADSAEGTLALRVRSPSGERWVGSKDVFPLFISQGNGPETLGALTPPAGGPEPALTESAAAFVEVGTYSFGFALEGGGGGERALERGEELELELVVDRLGPEGGQPGGALAPEPMVVADGAEPMEEDAGTAPEAPDPAEPAAGGVRIPGGDSLNAAPVLAPGAYESAVATGGDAYYAVLVPAGQRAQVAVELDLSAGPRRRFERELRSFLLASYTPAFQPASEDSELAEGRSTLVRTRTERAEPAAELIEEVGAGELNAPGVWYFRLHASEPFGGEARSVEVPAEIDVQLKGKPVDVPAAEQALGEAGAGGEPAAASEEREGSEGFGLQTFLLVLAGAVLVAAGAAVALHRRTMRG